MGMVPGLNNSVPALATYLVSAVCVWLLKTSLALNLRGGDGGGGVNAYLGSYAMNC